MKSQFFFNSVLLLSSLLGIARSSPIEQFNKSALEERATGGIYLCSNQNWSGTCGYKVQPMNSYINLGTDWNKKIAAFGPDSGNWYCTLYENFNCNGASINLGYPGSGNLDAQGFLYRASSFECYYGSSGTSTTYSGDMTYFDDGLGSCGWQSLPGDAIVALASFMMNNGANPNNNPLCGKHITSPITGRTMMPQWWIHVLAVPTATLMSLKGYSSPWRHLVLDASGLHGGLLEEDYEDMTAQGLRLGKKDYTENHEWRSRDY